MLEVNNLRVRYGSVEAVRGVSLTVAQGETVALLGSNGAGKSSTIVTRPGPCDSPAVRKRSMGAIVGLSDVCGD